MRLKTELPRFRRETGMTQSGLAALVGVRRETIVNLENGRYNPSLRLAMDLADVFHTTVEELFRFEAEKD
ncbi:helix-turn-helix protein [Caprobacter fermentans]|uniref:Helix-turn-helix protein n=1 Tax=Caproicibacter fermentans TaxID=2576756 RepID=A0A6N8I2D8_9FIRM|nr:helix-turn-helix transcriptional regulator [Caproicibacter fermentans]MVB12234.1 helix-turn-helix protein [Caproicibacter fermentans]OCN01115.1 transcriptional regulator [Clostridium sp. W14A]QNK39671.1 helix-turn-helix transcriptional regulator [Caproicibacter fermentans]